MIDLQKFVDCFVPMTCIISVETFSDGSYGKIRLVAGNKAYIDSIERNPNAPKMLSNKFVPNSEYQRYLPKDLNFEDSCYRCAVLKQPLHAYVHPDRFDFWFNLFFLPLESDEEGICYCTYIQEVTKQADTSQMSDLSHKTTEDVLRTSIKLRGSSDFKKTMNEVIKDIRSICGANYCCILLMDATRRTCSVLCEDVSEEGRSTYIENWLPADFYDIAESWAGTIAGSNCLIVKNKSDMDVVRERNSIWYGSLISARVDSIVLFPLKHGDELLGYIWATNFKTEQAARIKETLELTTFFLASEIANHQLFEKLKILGSTDMLTGVLNRNEMNNRVDQLCEGKAKQGESIGIVFADLNGLKRVNDNEGHLAGDLLLKEAALLLQEVFGENEVYRAGGDEFMVMVWNADVEELCRLSELLKNKSASRDNVCFAVGYSFEEDAKNVRRAMMMADARMYEDKKRYYEQFPEKKRK